MTTDLERVHQQENQPALHFGSFNSCMPWLADPRYKIADPAKRVKDTFQKILYKMRHQILTISARVYVKYLLRNDVNL